MFATSADPKTVEEMQELLEESIKGVGHGISSFWGAPRTVAGLGGLVVCTYICHVHITLFCEAAFKGECCHV